MNYVYFALVILFCFFYIYFFNRMKSKKTRLFRKMIALNPPIFDFRSKQDFEDTHFHNAIWLQKSQIPQKLGKYVSVKDFFIFYSSSKKESRKITKILYSLGYQSKNFLNMGGFLDLPS